MTPAAIAKASPPRLLPRLARAMLGPLLLAVTSMGWSAGADSEKPSQYDVEAAYLYDFGKFVRWPADPHHIPMNLCILGQDPFGHVLDRIVAGEKINGRPLAVYRLANDAGTRNCSILFLGASGGPRPNDAPNDTPNYAMDRVIASVAGEPVLTVSNLPGFLERGGEIQFVFENDRVRFAVNLNAVNRNGLVLQSELLKVAVRVIGKPRVGGAR